MYAQSRCSTIAEGLGVLQLTFNQPLAEGHFSAMASDCQVLMECADWLLAARLLEGVQRECKRIEHKFSRYRADSLIAQIHAAQGQPVTVDAETARLLDFADQLYRLSEGAFDISSGVLREVWQFDGSDRVPSTEAVNTCLARVGWSKAGWQSPQLTLPQGMQIDLGGIGKEYAVDRCFDWLASQFDGAFLINFGGDLRARGPRLSGQAWQVGIESISQPDAKQATFSTTTHRKTTNAAAQLALITGAVATSGDSQRYVMYQGQRLGHILDPRTGWPVQHAPHAITVYAQTCTQAGMVATLAMLQGANAATFLAEQQQLQEIQSWMQA
jgi:thiamine biosynthesis lipoprotein